MDDLIPWLRTQLDEDERIARAVEDHSPPWDGQWKNDGDHALRTYNGWVLAHNGGKPYATGLLDHIARHDPARVLAEVDAKRRILDLHPHQRFATLPSEWPDHWKAETQQAFPGTTEPYVGCGQCAWNTNYEVVEPDWWCEYVQLLAAPYADRPGYREEWKP